MKTEPNQPISPQVISWIGELDKPALEAGGGDFNIQCLGLTKREHFAAMAMKGLLANPNRAMQENNYRTESPDGLAKVALAHADALITALNQ